jgi:hypothetical protein
MQRQVARRPGGRESSGACCHATSFIMQHLQNNSPSEAHVLTERTHTFGMLGAGVALQEESRCHAGESALRASGDTSQGRVPACCIV